MATKTINKARIQQRIDTTANWTTNDPVLLSGEFGIEELTDGTFRIKVGNGTNKWSGLAYEFSQATLSSLQAVEDAVKGYANSAKTSADNASTSETNSKKSETNAKASETNAAKSATSASDSATSASESANSAKTSADNAASINQQVIDNSYGLSVVDGCLNMTYEG